MPKKQGTVKALNPKFSSTTVRSDVEEHVAKERLACNDKNISAWPKNISVLYNLAHHILHCTL